MADALLVIALASQHALRAADFDMDDDVTADRLRDAAGCARRAADFIAGSIGRDLGAVLGGEYASAGGGVVSRRSA